MSEYSQRLANLMRHIDKVRDDCVLLGQRIVAKGNEHLGHRLIKNGFVHDNSKFSGIEWEYLNDGAWPYQAKTELENEMFQTALRQHTSTNSHHPEYWRGIQHMPPECLAEMVCDWHTRSSEQGNDMFEWVRDKATERFGFTTKQRVYRDIKSFVELLLERRFS